MFSVETFANDSFTYSANVALANDMTWSINSHCVTLDFMPVNIWQANSETNVWYPTDIGTLTATLSPIVTATPNSINYTYTISANTFQTQTFVINGVNPTERVLIIQTKFTSNTGFSFNANNLFLRIKNNGM
jgi:hypothetical protein